MTIENIEQRVATLEKEIAALKRQAAIQTGQNGTWPDMLFGRMKEFPEWDAICREGKQLGNAANDNAS